MSTPGDYYRRKAEEAIEAQAKLDNHKRICVECGRRGYCKTSQQLEARLELARYVGD